MEEIVLGTRGLVKSYGPVRALRGVDLTLRRGESLALLGHNGAGKTSFVECALGLRKADAGQARVLGLDPTADRRRLFERVGVQFQESGWQDRIKVGELCRLSASLYACPRDWRELLSRFGLADKLGAYVAALSGGQRQRLAVLLAFLPGPELVVLDELTTGLDPAARHAVWDQIDELRSDGCSVLLVSHYMDEVERLCGRAAILKDGLIVAEGSPKELTRQAGAKNLEEAFLRLAGPEGMVA